MSIVIPGTKAEAEVVQPTRDFHHQVTDTVLPVADFVLHDPTALHTADGMLNPHFLACNSTVRFFLLQGEFATTGLLGWLPNSYRRDGKALKPHVLIQDSVSR